MESSSVCNHTSDQQNRTTAKPFDLFITWAIVKIRPVPVEHCTRIAEVVGSNPLPAWIFLGLNFTTAQAMFITAKIAFIFTSLSVVHLYDLHTFTVIYSSLHGFINKIMKWWAWHSNHNYPVNVMGKSHQKVLGTVSESNRKYFPQTLGFPLFE